MDVVIKYFSFRQLTLFAIAGMICFLSFKATAQFEPPAGQPGSTAIKADSAVFVAWASSCLVERGYVDISDTTLGYATYGMDTVATGVADNNVVSLGDGGNALVYFETPLTDGPGFDFAVFENSFSDDFLELAFVEVSSDGTHFFRFPSVSYTQTEVQVETFDTLDATKVHNLAGKYRGGYGTPFDLAELDGVEGLDVHHIVAVRIVDVIGSIDTAYATYDSEGNIINDPWPTPFESSGFDLDAVGVIHDLNHTSVAENSELSSVIIFPNPAKGNVTLHGLKPGSEVVVYDLWGHTLSVYPFVQTRSLPVSLIGLPKGLLFVRITYKDFVIVLKVIHL
jgi:hypothetical protein